MSDGGAREPVTFLVFAASLRRGSFYAHLVESAAGILARRHPGRRGSADPARELGAFVVSSPTDNASIPGVLKNAIDWVSRFRPQPFHERDGLLLFRVGVDGRRQPGRLGASRPFGASRTCHRSCAVTS
jgi:NAD(P)H-dependent FMN reductase